MVAYSQQSDARNATRTQSPSDQADARPRVPLPRQTGGVHEDKTKRPCRERKHKKKNCGGLGQDVFPT
jgi:hypothetical protein